ncbi:baculoviral IAP repeat-containing protein 8 [Ciona intestinalis]
MAEIDRQDITGLASPSLTQHKGAKAQILPGRNCCASNSVTAFDCKHPYTKNMENFRERIRTFISWPRGVTKATPVEIAKAGFFYLNERDRAKCFYCNGGLQNWEPNDEPWFEHAKWFPNCDFLLRKKGIEFVQNVAGRFPNLNRPLLNDQVTPKPSTSNTPCPAPSSPKQTEVLQSSASHIETRPPLEEAMESELVLAVSGFGFERELVQLVVERLLQETGSVNCTIMELVTATQQLEQKQREENAMEVVESFEMNQEMPEIACAQSNLSTSPTDVSPMQTPCNLTEQQIPGSRKMMYVKQKEVSVPAPSEQSLAQQKNQLQNLKDEMRCKICLDNPMDCILLECGHVCTCLECSQGIRTCPICRQKITKIMKIYRDY